MSYDPYDPYVDVKRWTALLQEALAIAPDVCFTALSESDYLETKTVSEDPHNAVALRWVIDEGLQLRRSIRAFTSPGFLMRPENFAEYYAHFGRHQLALRKVAGLPPILAERLLEDHMERVMRKPGPWMSSTPRPPAR